MKTIIIKNNTPSDIQIDSLGIKIPQSQQVELNYEELLEVQDSTEFFTLIDNNSIIMNDGTSDLNSSEARSYVSFETDLSNYYNKGEIDTIASECAPIVHTHNDLYYLKGEVDSIVSGVEGYGIVGAVDDIDDLPENYTGNVGDIYIVRISVGQGSGGPQAFVTTTDTGLYLPMEDSWQDALGHSGNDYSSMAPVSSPLTPPFGTKYCDFDGYNDWIKFYSNDDFGEGPTLTVGGWIYTERTGTYGIIGRWDDDGNGWKLDIFGNKLRASLDTLSMSEVQFKDPNNISQNEWTHVAMVYDGNYCILYRNATEVNRVSANGTVIDSYNMDIKVGRWMGDSDDDDDDEDKMFEGGMKDFFVHNAAMTQEQLQHLVSGNIESFADEGFYQWDGSQWNFLARNTGENGGGVGSSYHNSLLGLNSDEYQHLSQNEKLELTGSENTSLHKHDDRYYTESEIDTKLNNKSDTSHIHDDRYYTKGEINSLTGSIDYSYISNNDSNTDVTGQELESLTDGSNADHLHTHSGLGGGINGKGLDDAYNGHNQLGRWGEGREINVDHGSVQINASNGFAPFKLNPITYKPTQWLSGGELCVYDGELFLYDSVRGKWLSVSGYYIGGGFNNNNIRNTYLKGYNGTSFTDDVGWVAPWPGTIVAMAISNDNDGTTNSVKIRSNGSNISGAELWYNGQRKNHTSNLNCDFNEGSVLNFYVDGNNNNCDRPQVWAIIKRRMV